MKQIYNFLNNNLYVNYHEKSYFCDIISSLDIFNPCFKALISIKV